MRKELLTVNHGCRSDQYSMRNNNSVYTAIVDKRYLQLFGRIVIVQVPKKPKTYPAASKGGSSDAAGSKRNLDVFISALHVPY